MIANISNLKAIGEARIRLIDNRVLDECRRLHPDWPHDEIRLLALRRIDEDTGWSKNVITDYIKREINESTSLGSSVRVFIHKGTVPGLACINFLQNTYADQTPNQVRIPDTFTANGTTLLQTRTVQFPSPSVARVINSVGLTLDTAADASTTGAGAIQQIAAYTRLSSTINQGTSQAADVQYRITFSLDL